MGDSNTAWWRIFAYNMHRNPKHTRVICQEEHLGIKSQFILLVLFLMAFEFLLATPLSLAQG
jgi:hypothetical protein